MDRLLDTPFTNREQVRGSLVAVGLWLFSVTLLGVLAVWSWNIQ